MEPAKKIAQARVAMLLDYPFWGHLALSLEIEEKKNMPMPTMATNGTTLYYDPEFVEKCSLGELMFVVAHEVAHCALNHIPRGIDHVPSLRKKIGEVTALDAAQAHRWNMAADFAANDLLVREPPQPHSNMTPPKGALIPGQIPGTDDFKEKYAEYIFGKLPEPIVITLTTLDSHGEWREWGKGEGKGQGNGEKDKNGNSKGEKPGEQNGEGKAQGAGDDGDEGDPLEQEWREKVAAAATAARMAGKFPAHLETLVGDLLQPKLDWKTILRDTIVSCAKNDYRTMPPNKKYVYRGIYLPSLMGEQINIAVAIDSSGSISDEEIREFMSEVKGICDAYQDYMIYLFICDAKIHGRWELHPFDPLPKLAGGRGGTSYKPVFAEVKKLPFFSSLVYLTDGYPNDSFPPEPPFQVIWVLISDVKPPYGKLIKLPRGK